MNYADEIADFTPCEISPSKVNKTAQSFDDVSNDDKGATDEQREDKYKEQFKKINKKKRSKATPNDYQLKDAVIDLTKQSEKEMDNYGDLMR